MGQLFAKPPPKAPPTTEKRTVSDKDRAVLKLKRSRDKLTKFQRKTDINAEKLQKQAKELIQNGRKDRALMALKIRKLKLNEVASVDRKLMNVVRMIEDIEWESQNVEVLQALEAGTAALDKLHQEMPIEEVERILEESAESIEVQSLIGDMLSEGQLTGLDEEELEAQLEALGEDDAAKETKQEAGGEQMSPATAAHVHGGSGSGVPLTPEISLPDAPTTPVFPVVPTHDVTQPATVGSSDIQTEEAVHSRIAV